MAPESVGMNASLATASAQAEMSRFQTSMADLKTRLAPGKNGEADEKQLRQACKDFEAVFIGKMWQEMQKTVPKEGYLHGKQEEMYTSMFDQAMSEHLAEAGGVGLADMLYDQLASRLKSTSKNTLPGNVGIEPLAEKQGLAAYRPGESGSGEAHALNRGGGMPLERPGLGGSLSLEAEAAKDAQAAQLSVQMKSVGEEWVNVDSLEEGDGAS